MKTIAAFISGLLFSAGLMLSGMTEPANIAGFLDFFGDWRPALAFVMAGAVGVYASLYRLVLKRKTPLFSLEFHLPSQRKIDARLIAGSLAFGVGWGLSGLCPGPAWVAIGMFGMEAGVFFIFMIVGVLLFNLASRSGGSSVPDNDSCG
jgi:uncharacterized membrane protein YedE/YeeE